MYFKKYFFCFIMVFLIVPVFSFIVNYFFDPFLIFKKNSSGYLLGCDERIVKSVHLSNNLNIYDSVLIGSSRSTYIDTGKIRGYKCFNNSLSGIHINEYLPYLEYFSETQGTPKLIILSLDFHSTNMNLKDYPDPKVIIHQAKSKLHLVSHYMKFGQAIKNVNLWVQPSENKKDFYIRKKLVKVRVDQGNGFSNNELSGTLTFYNRYCFLRYIYNESYQSKLDAIKKRFPEARIIAIICPVHQSLIEFTKVRISGNNYGRWLNEISKVFHELYDFSSYKEIISERSNFFDPAHFYPRVGDLMMKEIFENREENINLAKKLRKYE